MKLSFSFLKNINTRWMSMACAVFLGGVVASAALSHELEQTSAHVVLRDGQISMRVYVDTEHWLETLQDPLAWLTGESDFLSYLTDRAITLDGHAHSNKTIDILGDYLAMTLQFTLDGEAITFNALSHSTDGSDESSVTEFQFNAAHTNRNPEQVSIAFPATLGSVYVSLVQPQYRSIPAGENGEFSISP